MKKTVLTTFAFNMMYAQRLVDDVSQQQMAAQPSCDGHDVPNHAAWVIGHLAATCDFGGGLLGKQGIAPADWDELFGNNSTPTTDASRYPDKATLMAALTAGGEYLVGAYEAATDEVLAGQTPHEQMRQMFPTVDDVIVFVLTAHAPIHLGQLSAWRRAMGLGPVF